jgi:hypothetical protein
MDSGDDVQLPDLQVIQRYSLAVRGASAPRADVIEALQSDLTWLTGGGRRRPAAPARKAAASPAKRTQPTKTAAKKAAPVAKRAAPVAKKKPAAKRTGARRA